nr:hypothetical protein [Methanospirillum hungatei]
MVPPFIPVFLFQLNRLFGAEIDTCQTEETMMLPNRLIVNYPDVISRTNLIAYTTSITSVINMKPGINF